MYNSVCNNVNVCQQWSITCLSDLGLGFVLSSFDERCGDVAESRS